MIVTSRDGTPIAYTRQGHVADPKAITPVLERFLES